MRDPYFVHGPSRRWWRPWKIRCWCGAPWSGAHEDAARAAAEVIERDRLEILVTLEEADIPVEQARQRWEDAVRYVDGWRNEQRSRRGVL